LFQNPTDSYPNGFTTLGGYTVRPGVNSTAYANNKILRIFWMGLKYEIRDDLYIVVELRRHIGRSDRDDRLPPIEARRPLCGRHVVASNRRSREHLSQSAGH
jgi:hypothetical protein